VNHDDHVRLIRDGVPRGDNDDEPHEAPVWADIGSGGGAFTLALADLLGAGATIHSVDRDAGRLREQARALHAAFPTVTLEFLVGDFTRPLDLPPLDGIVMANALHFVRDQSAVVSYLRHYLKPGGRFILVEYDTDRGNHWVPYPLSYRTWQALAPACGFGATRLLATVPSRFLGAIYAALSR
jgi:SAM-dependent methyltransferase